MKRRNNYDTAKILMIVSALINLVIITAFGIMVCLNHIPNRGFFQMFLAMLFALGKIFPIMPSLSFTLAVIGDIYACKAKNKETTNRKANILFILGIIEIIICIAVFFAMLPMSDVAHNIIPDY